MTKSISMNEFNKLVKNKANVIDVRETYEFQSGHIKGSVNIPLSQLTVKTKELEKDKSYLLVCASGARSANACDYLSRMGYNVTNVKGGIMAWRGELE